MQGELAPHRLIVVGKGRWWHHILIVVGHDNGNIPHTFWVGGEVTHNFNVAATNSFCIQRQKYLFMLR